MNLVVNEWLLEYFRPDTPASSRANLAAFFEDIQRTDRKIVIGRETPFTVKYYRYMKMHGKDMVFKRNYVTLNRLLFQDPRRTIMVEKTEMVRVTDEDMSGVDKDDRYLLGLVSSVPGSMIVSTDSRLIKALSGKGAFPIVHLEEYLHGKF